MTKRSLSDQAPSAACTETEDVDDVALDEDDSSPDEHEQPPTKTLKGIGQAPAAKQRGPNRKREWKQYNRWSRSDHSDAEFMSFIRADLAELNKRAGIKLPSTPLPCWLQFNNLNSSDNTAAIIAVVLKQNLTHHCHCRQGISKWFWDQRPGWLWQGLMWCGVPHVGFSCAACCLFQAECHSGQTANNHRQMEHCLVSFRVSTFDPINVTAVTPQWHSVTHASLPATSTRLFCIVLEVVKWRLQSTRLHVLARWSWIHFCAGAWALECILCCSCFFCKFDNSGNNVTSQKAWRLYIQSLPAAPAPGPHM